MADKTELSKLRNRVLCLDSGLSTVRDLLGEAQIHTDALRKSLCDMIDEEEEEHARKD